MIVDWFFLVGLEGDILELLSCLSNNGEEIFFGN